MKKICTLLMVLLLPLATAASAAEFGGSDPFAQQEEEFLPVDEAFVFSHLLVEDDQLLLRWEMPDGYYLYKHRLGFETRPGAQLALGVAQIPQGKEKFDEFEGDVEVYYHELEIRLPVSSLSANAEVGVSYQGCADRGLCYPPEQRWVTLMPTSADGATGAAPTQPLTAAAAPAEPLTEDQSFAATLAQSSLLVVVGLFFLAGIGLAFTPCVLPMVPILSGIIIGEGEGLSRRRALTLSFAYVFGMAVTYALVGTLVGLFGAELNLQAKLQSPAVLITFAIVFVLLAFSMFGFYELQLPSGLQNRLNELGSKQGGGKHFSVLIMGSLSSLVVSPCVSAPLTGALVYISQTENAVLGGTALLALGFGMGVPLMLVGAGGGHFLPRAGAWMDTVKAVFGVGLLAVAIWLLERVIAPELTLALWAALLIGSGVYMGALDWSQKQGWSQLWKSCGFIGVVYGVMLLIGAASGAVDPLRPLAPLVASSGAAQHASGGAVGHATHEDWRDVDTLAGLSTVFDEARSTNRPVLLDLYADWCISCKVMERSVFPQPEVASRLSQFILVRADITENNDEHKALLNAFGLFGPPSMVFFAPDGNEIAEVRLQGELDTPGMTAHLQRVLERKELGSSPNMQISSSI